MSTTRRTALLRPALAVASLFGAAAPLHAHVDLLDPVSGATLTADTVYQLRWTVAIAHNLQNWDLWYSTISASGPWTTIAMDLPPGDPAVGSNHSYDWLVPHVPTSPVYIRVRMDNAATDYEDAAAITIQTPCSAPVNYCQTAPNEVGAGATLRALGSVGIAANDLELQVLAAVPNQTGFFIYSGGQQQVAFGSGFLCITTSPFIRLAPAVSLNNMGNKRRLVDFSAAPAAAGHGMITAGSTWHFQFWYLDPNGPGPGTFNMSDALSITFCP